MHWILEGIKDRWLDILEGVVLLPVLILVFVIYGDFTNKHPTKEEFSSKPPCPNPKCTGDMRLWANDDKMIHWRCEICDEWAYTPWYREKQRIFRGILQMVRGE